MNAIRQPARAQGRAVRSQRSVTNVADPLQHPQRGNNPLLVQPRGMNKPATHQLYVNLSASQTRKRLRGHGFGVRRVEAADRHQAVIFHTATGQHLRELQSLFSDVLTSVTPALESPLETLRNLGPASAAWLMEAGIRSAADLRRMGPALAYRKVKQIQPDASLNLLWALAGAIDDRDWRDLTEHDKRRLRLEAGQE